MRLPGSTMVVRRCASVQACVVLPLHAGASVSPSRTRVKAFAPICWFIFAGKATTRMQSARTDRISPTSRFTLPGVVCRGPRYQEWVSLVCPPTLRRGRRCTDAIHIQPSLRARGRSSPTTAYCTKGTGPLVKVPKSSSAGSAARNAGRGHWRLSRTISSACLWVESQRRLSATVRTVEPFGSSAVDGPVDACRCYVIDRNLVSVAQIDPAGPVQ